jgi:ATP-binding cassette subfamily B protein
MLVWLFAIASTVASIVGPKILGRATTKLFEGVMAQIAGNGTIDFTYIGHIIVEVLFLYLLSAMLAYVQGWIMSNVAMNITYRFRKDISEKINRMPFKYFDGTNHGEILSRITNDVDTVSQTLNQSLTQIITSVTTVVGVLIMMFTISWQMTLVRLPCCHCHLASSASSSASRRSSSNGNRITWATSTVTWKRCTAATWW